jgi:hypothetical protein
MSKISRQILIGALTVMFLSSGCGRLTLASPTPVWTDTPRGQPPLPTMTPAASANATSTSVPITPEIQIPITGENVVSIQCQFCVDSEPHAILVFPDVAYFNVDSSAPVSCLTADVVDGRRILICHGPQSTSFNLNICSDPSNCLQFPVALQTCSLLQGDASPLATTTPFAPFFLTPVNTLNAPNKKPTQPAGTAVPSSTPHPAATVTSYP